MIGSNMFTFRKKTCPSQFGVKLTSHFVNGTVSPPCTCLLQPRVFAKDLGQGEWLKTLNDLLRFACSMLGISKTKFTKWWFSDDLPW